MLACRHDLLNEWRRSFDTTERLQPPIAGNALFLGGTFLTRRRRAATLNGRSGGTPSHCPHGRTVDLPTLQTYLACIGNPPPLGMMLSANRVELVFVVGFG